MGENNYTIEKLNAGCRKVLDGQDLDFGMAIVQSYKHDLSVCAKYQAPKEYCVLINNNEQKEKIEESFTTAFLRNLTVKHCWICFHIE